MQHTPWKKSRTYGDNYGGAGGHRDADNIRIRLHSFQTPSEFECLPVVRVDNPSRNWFHPLNAEQVRYALHALPPEDHGDVTHVWLRRIGKPFRGNRFSISDAVWGSGVSLVTLYPTRRNLVRDHGTSKPSLGAERVFRNFGARIRRNGKNWQTIWTLAGLRKFYIQEALYSSVAYHSAYVWRDGRSNSVNAREQRMEDWLFRKQGLAEKVYLDLFR